MTNEELDAVQRELNHAIESLENADDAITALRAELAAAKESLGHARSFISLCETWHIADAKCATGTRKILEENRARMCADAAIDKERKA